MAHASASNMPRQSPQVDMAWKHYPEVKLKIDNLPNGVNTLDVFRVFAAEGIVSRIELPDGQGKKTFVVFDPPPRRAFWQANETYPMIKDPQTNVKVKLVCSLCKDGSTKHQSPIDSRVYYPQRIRMTLNTIDFGYMIDEDAMLVMRTIEPPREHQARAIDMELVLDLRGSRKVEINFQIPKHELGETDGNPHKGAQYRFAIPIETLDQVYERGSPSSGKEILISLSKPPEFYRRSNDVQGTHDAQAKSWENKWTWLRQTEIVNSLKQTSEEPLKLRKEHAVIDIGRWTTYRFCINEKTTMRTSYDLIKRALSDYSVLFLSGNYLKIKSGAGLEAPVWQSIDTESRLGGMSSTAMLDFDASHAPLTNAVKHQLEVCISNGLLNEFNIDEDFLEKLGNLSERRAVGILENVADSRTPYYDPSAIFFLRAKPPMKRKHMGGHYTSMRAVQVTPSTIHVLTPLLETSNRIIRHFASHEDRFLRVKFVDEIGGLRAGGADTMKAVFERVLRALKHGIRIGDRVYEFLAFGNSQFREHGAYFFASDSALNAEDIRRWMCDLTHIRVVAKWAARLGQSFSTTRSISSVKVAVRTETDIERQGYIFTDGVGRISTFLAQMIARESKLPGWQDEYPSAFQFRLGGCKGVLTLDPKLPGGALSIRPSQYKFAAKHEGLDICRVASYAVPKLNRQIILVLRTLGIRDGTFMRMLENELSELALAMEDRDIAVNLLTRRVDFNQMTVTVAQMVEDGFMAAKDPFALAILRLWRAWTVKTLKEKANLAVDQGAFVLGCVDETASLKGWTEDRCKRGSTREESIGHLPEIFIQVREKPNLNAGALESLKSGRYVVKTGVCIFARNPSLHPGDIRIVQAVDVPALHHLKDVVVVPQTGERDLPNMCSGGDLDGDDFMVIWDPHLIPAESEWFHEAMDFTPPKPTPLNRPVTIDDIAHFFISYIKSNRLGQIAHAHLAHADRSPNGVFDEKCIELAELHSCAVDFPKSGIEVVIPKRLRVPYGEWPHFMEKGKESRRSSSVLGKMYDRIQLVGFEQDFTAPFDSRILDAYDFDTEDMQAHLASAKEIKVEYDNAVRRIMAKHGISTEFEIWSTFVLQHTKTGSDYKFHEEIGSLSSALKDRFRELCIHAAGEDNSDGMGPYVAAMYKVTADEVGMAVAIEKIQQMQMTGKSSTPNRKRASTSMPLISFPWIFHSELGKLAAGRMLSMPIKTRKEPSKNSHLHSTPPVTPMEIATEEIVVEAESELSLLDDTASAQQDRRCPTEELEKSRWVAELREVLEPYSTSSRPASDNATPVADESETESTVVDTPRTESMSARSLINLLWGDDGSDYDDSDHN